jgi:hypothetical protein
MNGREQFKFPNPGEVGEEFQRFVFQALRLTDPRLVSFAGVGKDGAIDLSSTLGECRHVVECKYIGEDGLAAAKQRWAKTKNHLKDNLAKFCEGNLSEKQYLPWTTTIPRIERYTFCVSSSLGNQNAKDQLRNEINQFFSLIE